jgi:hypothetical protein
MLASSRILTAYSYLAIQQLHGIMKSVLNQNLLAFMSYIYILCLCLCVCVYVCVRATLFSLFLPFYFTTFKLIQVSEKDCTFFKYFSLDPCRLVGAILKILCPRERRVF